MRSTRRSCTQKGETADHIGSRLTLRKLHLALFKCSDSSIGIPLLSYMFLVFNALQINVSLTSDDYK